MATMPQTVAQKNGEGGAFAGRHGLKGVGGEVLD